MGYLEWKGNEATKEMRKGRLWQRRSYQKGKMKIIRNEIKEERNLGKKKETIWWKGSIFPDCRLFLVAWLVGCESYNPLISHFIDKVSPSVC